MVSQYTRAKLNEVFVEMKNVILKLITDSDADLWVDREGDDGKMQDTADRIREKRPRVREVKEREELSYERNKIAFKIK